MGYSNVDEKVFSVICSRNFRKVIRLIFQYFIIKRFSRYVLTLGVHLTQWITLSKTYQGQHFEDLWDQWKSFCSQWIQHFVFIDTINGKTSWTENGQICGTVSNLGTLGKVTWFFFSRVMILRLNQVNTGNCFYNHPCFQDYCEISSCYFSSSLKLIFFPRGVFSKNCLE